MGGGVGTSALSLVANVPKLKIVVQDLAAVVENGKKVITLPYFSFLFLTFGVLDMGREDARRYQIRSSSIRRFAMDLTSSASGD